MITVQFNLLEITGVAADRKITITPVTALSALLDDIVAGKALVLQTAGGTASQELVPGDYRITISKTAGSFTISVPSGTDTISAVDLVNSGLATYNYIQPSPLSVAGGYVYLNAALTVRVGALGLQMKFPDSSWHTITPSTAGNQFTLDVDQTPV